MSRDLYRDIEHREGLKALIESAITDRLQVSYGRIDEYDVATHSVRVRILPQVQTGSTGKGILTGFIPMQSLWGGAGWGIQGTLLPGQAHALVVNIGGMHGVEFAVGPFYTGALKAPVKFNGAKGGAEASLQGGELGMRHASGSQVILRNDGSLSFTASDGTRLDLLSSGSIDAESTGDVKIKAPGGVEILSDAASVSLEARVNVNATALAKIVITAPLVDISGQAAVEISSNTSVTIKAPSVTVKAPAVSLVGEVLVTGNMIVTGDVTANDFHS